jgi:hypothetical protein
MLVSGIGRNRPHIVLADRRQRSLTEDDWAGFALRM